MARSLQSQVLVDAIELYQKNTRECRFRLARTVLGIPWMPYWPGVRQVCAQGAVIRSAYNLVGSKKEALILARKILELPELYGLYVVNDYQGPRPALVKMRAAALVA